MRKSTKIGLYFLMVIAVFIGMSALLGVLPIDTDSVNASYIFGQISIFIPVMVYIICTGGQDLKDIHFRKIKIENALIIVVFAWLCMPVAGFLNVISMMFANNYVAASVGSLTENYFIVNLIMMAVVPAVLEELAYRGIVYYGLRQYGIVAAVIVSGLMFGLNHMNVNQFLYAALLGMALALVDEASDSILASMIMHFVFNLNTVLLIQLYKILPYLEKISGETLSDSNQKLSGGGLADAATSLADYPVKTKIILVCVYGVMAAVAFAANFYIYRWYAKRNGRMGEIKDAFCRWKDGFRKGEEGRIVSLPMILGAVVCVFFMAV